MTTDQDDKFPPTVAEVRARTLVGVVQAELERRILGGRIDPGARLNEQTIADELSVSRGPVREACRGLAEIGLVTLIPNRGAFVKQLTRTDAIDVYDLRAGLLGLSASLLAARMDPQITGALDDFVEQMEEAAQGDDATRFGKLNTAFHDCIVRSSGNARLTRLYRGLVKEFQLFRVHAVAQPGSLVVSNREHREIELALKAGDATLSYRISSGHVEHGKQRMLNALETAGGPPAANTQPARGRRRDEQDQR
jgi:DNA-binding GntR family transcriptional regulator